MGFSDLNDHSPTVAKAAGVVGTVCCYSSSFWLCLPVLVIATGGCTAVVCALYRATFLLKSEEDEHLDYHFEKAYTSIN